MNGEEKLEMLYLDYRSQYPPTTIVSGLPVEEFGRQLFRRVSNL